MARNTTLKPDISVIIPVYEEGETINDTVRHLRQLAGDGGVEIVVVDGGPGQRTLPVIEDRDVLAVSSRAGRGIQMNEGAARAQGDTFLFLHADTRLPENGFNAVRRAVQDGAAAGAFSLAIDSRSFGLSVVALFANIRCRLERVPYGDQAQFLRASTFRALGGFAPIPLMEDVEFFRRIRRRRIPVSILPEKVTTSSRRWDNEGILRRTLKNWRLRLRYAFGAAPDTLAAEYRPHNTEES